MDAYDKRALKETLVFLALFVVLLVGLFLAVDSTMPTFAESVAHCRAACEANNMVMKGYSSGKHGGCSCEVRP